MPRLVHITTVPISLVALIGDQVTYMKQQGLDVHGISSPGAFSEKFTRTQQAPFHSIPMTREITPLKDIISLWRLWMKLRSLKPDIVHSHTPKAGLLGTLAAWLTRTNIRIYHLHGLRYSTASGTKRRLLIFSERIACRLATEVISVSKSVKQQALIDKLCPPNKIITPIFESITGVDAEVCFNPANFPEEICEKIRSQYNIPADAKVIGFVGRIVRDKGVIELAAAWQQLKNDYPEIHWLVVGPFETEDPIPDEVRRLLEMDERIHLAGYVDKELMPAVLSAIDILAFPSYREGFPLTPLEAAAMCVPTVAARATGSVDAVVDGITGIIVPVKDTDALAEALRNYIDDPQLRQKHGKAARERVLRDFRPEDIWKAIYDTYIELLRDHDVIEG